MPEIPLGHLITVNMGGSEYPVASPDDARNVLSVRDSREAPRHLASQPLVAGEGVVELFVSDAV